MLTSTLYSFFLLLTSLLLTTAAPNPVPAPNPKIATDLKKIEYSKAKDATMVPWAYYMHLSLSPSDAELKTLARDAYDEMLKKQTAKGKADTTPTVMTALYVTGHGVFLHSSLRGVKDGLTPQFCKKLEEEGYPHSNDACCGEFGAIAQAIKAGADPRVAKGAAPKAKMHSVDKGADKPPCGDRKKGGVQCSGCYSYATESWNIDVI